MDRPEQLDDDDVVMVAAPQGGVDEDEGDAAVDEEQLAEGHGAGVSSASPPSPSRSGAA